MKSKALAIANTFLFILLILTKMDEVQLFYFFCFIFLNFIGIYHLYISETKTKNQKSEMKAMQEIKDENAIVKQTFFNLANSIKSGVLSIDEYGRITYVNKTLHNIFDMHLQTDSKITDIENEELRKLITTSYGRETYLDHTIQINEEHYRITINPIFNNTGNFMGCLLLATNVTNLVHSRILQKAFIADLSHEMKTPLAAIKLGSELLKNEDELEDEEKKDIIDIIHKESNRTEQLVRNILDLSQYDRMDFKLVLDTIDIKDVISEAIQVLRPSIEEKGLHLFDDSKSQIMRIDVTKIKQVILNLIKNALMYTNNGHISISTRIQQRNLEISVEDTGIGIHKDDLKNIFERFYRVDKNRSRETGGSGLGLPICAKIIEKHNGTIDVKSKLNKGTKFTISLPIDYIGEY